MDGQKFIRDKKQFSDKNVEKIHLELVQNIMTAAKIKKWIKINKILFPKKIKFLFLFFKIPKL